MDTTTALLEQAAALLARAVAAKPLDASDAVLLSRLAEGERVGRLVDALRVRLAAEAATRSRRELGTDSLAARHGQRSGIALVALATRVSEREAKRRIQIGAATAPRASLTGEPLPAEFPAVAAAMQLGSVGLDSSEAIIRCVRQADRAASVEDRDAAERCLTVEAAHLPADLVVLQARVWRERLDPDGAKPREDALTGERRFTIGPDKAGQLTPFWGQTDPLNAALIRAAMDTYGSPRKKPTFLTADDENTLKGLTPDDAAADDQAGLDGLTADSDAAVPDADGYRPLGDDVKDPRTPGQRAHDILFGLLKAGVQAENAGLPRNSITSVVATVALDDLKNGTGSAWLDGVGEPISALTVQEKLCDAGFRNLVLGNDGEVLHLDRDYRLFQPAQRIAAGVRDGGCVFPGCPAPPSWCEVHHVIPFGEGGPTDIDNAAVLCAFHHHVIHNGDWHIRIIRGKPQILAPPWVNPDRVWETVGKARVGLATTGPPG
jgi:hypothetical protein